MRGEGILYQSLFSNLLLFANNSLSTFPCLLTFSCSYKQAVEDCASSCMVSSLAVVLPNIQHIFKMSSLLSSVKSVNVNVDVLAGCFYLRKPKPRAGSASMFKLVRICTENIVVDATSRALVL